MRTTPLHDLPAWLDEAVGDARVVAVGESSHYNAENYRLRQAILRRLVERHGFRAYAMETGFPESRRVDDWVSRRGRESLGDVMAGGITSLMGLWREMRDHLEWMRQNGTVAFAGVDLGGSNASLLPGMDATIAYLAAADPGFKPDPAVRETAAAISAASPFSATAALAALAKLAAPERDALTSALADWHARMAGRRLDYIAITGADGYERALRSLRLTIALDAGARDMSRGDHSGMMYTRDVAMADTVEWVAARAGRVVFAAHNGHVQRWPATLPGMPPSATAGQHLADRLGDDYLVIGMTTGRGQALSMGPEFYAGRFFTDLGEPRPGSVDALLDAQSTEPFAVDLRRLSPDARAAVKAAGQQRLGPFYVDVDATAAYDVLVHLPHVTPATPDDEALAASPPEVREAFARYEKLRMDPSG
jgi:erythromycin esterase